MQSLFRCCQNPAKCVKDAVSIVTGKFERATADKNGAGVAKNRFVRMALLSKAFYILGVSAREKQGREGAGGGGLCSCLPRLEKSGLGRQYCPSGATRRTGD